MPIYIPQSVEIDPELLTCSKTPINETDTWSDALIKLNKAYAICADKVTRIKHIYELRSKQY